MNKVKTEIINAALGQVESVMPDKAIGRYLFPRVLSGSPVIFRDILSCLLMFKF